MNVENLIKADWTSDVKVEAACLKVWRSLISKSDILDHYTFHDLLTFSGQRNKRLLTKALLYLSSPRIQALEMCLMYEHDESYFELPKTEVAHYIKGKLIIHPDTGLALQKDDILVCFTPGALLRETATHAVR